MDDFSHYLLTSRSDRTESVTSIATYVKQAGGGEIPDDRTRIREIIASLPKAVQDAYLSGHNLAVLGCECRQCPDQSGNGRRGPAHQVVRRRPGLDDPATRSLS